MTSRLVDAYLAWLKLTGSRPMTVKARAQVVRAFARSVAPVDVAQVTRLHVEVFLGQDHLSPQSRETYRAALRGFYRWALEHEYVAQDRTAKVAKVKVPRGVPRPISEPDLLRAVEQADVRMRAWLLLMALAGLRCIEVAGLRPADLVQGPSGTLLHLRECKGGGTARVPAHPLILRALEHVPQRNELWWQVNAGTLSTQVNRYLRSVGITSTAHSLRHFAGTSWYRASGHDLLATAALLRHANVNTTQIYARIDDERPTEVVHAVGLTGLPHEDPPPPSHGAPPALRLVRPTDIMGAGA